ncbi:hypothetical protein BD770DRAFT_320533 [Pilaira anomala]|nr:hypothetical protein BD770DRAFT_320533 [Pilaira anomala]
MIDHLRLFKNSSDFPFLPLFDKEYRVSIVCPRSQSIWNTIFDAFDYYQLNEPMVIQKLPISTLMSLPLRKLVICNDQEHHWTSRHANFASYLFFIFDDIPQRLRLKIPGEYTRFPNLCARLFQDILTNRTVQLQPYVWEHILHSPSSSSMSTGFQEISTLNSRWLHHDRTIIRDHYQVNADATIRFHPAHIKSFWRCTMYPQARTIFFRAFSHCLPTKQTLSKFKMFSKNACSFCGFAEDSFEHFLVLCPPKQLIWKSVLSQYYPHLSFSSEDLLDFICYLRPPYWVRQGSQFTQIITTILWQQWILYWSHGNNNADPVSNAKINNYIPRIVSLIERLLHPHVD